MEAMVFTEPELGCSYRDLADTARIAEQSGWDGFFCADHYLGPSQQPQLPGPLDAWTTLAGLARDTVRLRLGTLMTCSTFRLPGPLAITVAQVDAMSGGRIELGIGAGHFDREHAAHGIPFPPVAQRFDRLEEQLEILTGLWDTPDDRSFSYQGRYYTLTGCPALPKPAQRPRVPVIIGGRGPRRTPGLAARFATEMNVSYQSPAVAAGTRERVRQACAAADRDPDTLAFSATMLLCCGRTQADVARRTAVVEQQMRNMTTYRGIGDIASFGAVGSPAEVVNRISAYAKVGFDRVYLHFRDPADTEQLELVGAEVLPDLPTTSGRKPWPAHLTGRKAERESRSFHPSVRPCR
jgi:F420-dependent oxidoreductase-like protein